MLRLLAFSFVLAGLPAMNALAQAQQGVTEIFKCRNESGQVTYTNDRRQAEKQKCELVTSQINVAPPYRPAPSRSASSFPRETPTTSAIWACERPASSRSIRRARGAGRVLRMRASSRA